MDTKAWNNILKDINAQLDIEECLKTSMNKVVDLLRVEMVSLMLLDQKYQELYIKAATGLSEEIVRSTKRKKGEGVSGWVAINKEPLLIKNITRDKRFKKVNGLFLIDDKYYNDSLLSVPLLAKGEVLGVINVNNKATKGIFRERDLNILKEIAEHISMAVYKALKYHEAKELSQIKLDFISVVSHELRSPLASIKGAIDLILEKVTGETNPAQEKFLMISRKNVDRVINLTDDLLDISKLESGKMDTKRNLQDICSLIKEVFETLKIDAQKKKIVLKIVIPDIGINMWFDADQIIRLLVNLAGNAIKFTQDNGIVSIRLEDMGNFVKITVVDNGPGIPEEDLDRIFDKFYSTVKLRPSGAKGTGLGLAISKEIVKLHKGRIWVDSQVGRGSRFSVTLPKDIRAVLNKHKEG